MKSPFILSLLCLCSLSARAAESKPSSAQAVAIAKMHEDMQMCLGGYLPDPKWVAESSVSWNAESSGLPFLPSQAKQSAIDAFHKYMANYMPMEVEAGNVRLHQVGEQWCYTISISFHRSDSILKGLPFWTCVHVRMDGVARVERSLLVTPEPEGLLLDRDKKEAAEQNGTSPPSTRSQSKLQGNDTSNQESEVPPR